MTTHKKDAIVIENVSKAYKLYHSTGDQLRDLLKLKTKNPAQEHYALKNINLNVKQGQRLAIIGRNGAGKSTLLKMLTANFKPTAGNIKIHGKVQALMNVGIGFHPEFSGYENIRASLTYNGLSPSEIDEAVEDIIDFVELGDYIHQPVKTYSLGMQSRLSFATATAIKPEILIVDEVLGAGDAYFSAKSADRMKALTNSGCTLLLVSHATSQVLQFCEQAIWLENGEIIKQGDALEIVKAYEAYSKKLEHEHFNHTLSEPKSSVIQSKWLREKLLKDALSIDESKKSPLVPDNILADENVASSRWPGTDNRLQITDVRVLNKDNKVVNLIQSGEPVDIAIEVKANSDGEYDCYFVILLFSEDGRWISRHCSDKYQFNLQEGEKTIGKLSYKQLCLGNGKFIFSAAIYKTLELDNLASAEYYDLLSRSFEFNVIAKDRSDISLLQLPVTWQVSDNTNELKQDNLIKSKELE